ncbi:hydroxyacid dehydrogenase [Agromyces sp. LHK192]|uniref:hydroxyacid dehydrogenase n=1 Tax=Agromyces sp. LHK192 TaxID=2498704 RepID=UPI001F0C9B5A|nr:hydroxyacid dehydrogenase [Agromyces sp. LHK192]
MHDLFDEAAWSRLRGLVRLHDDIATPGAPVPADVAEQAEILITGWGAGRLDADVLERWPRLRAVFHAAGSVKRLVSPELWDAGIRVASCADANALPVAEYTLAMILLSAKGTLESANRYINSADLGASRPIRRHGAYGITVGIVGASRIGRRVIDLLRPFDIRCLVFDPSLTTAEAAALGVELVPLAALMSHSDVVSVHAPSLPETHRMIGAAELARMPDDGILINTSRGALVDTDALVAEVASGRLQAILDVTDPEPLPTGHPLFSLPGVLLTPHVAGSLGNELRRIGDQLVSQVERYVKSGTFEGEIRASDLAMIA